MSRRLLAPLLAVASLALSPSARADLPPPDGTKFVGFEFTVDNLAAFKDYALLAYPCGGSNGAPVAEVSELKEGVSTVVGRRGGNCKLYSMPRADFDAWKKGVTGTSGEAVDALFKSPKVRACSGAPTIVGVLPTSDPRSTAAETLHVTQLDAAGCSVVHASSPSGGAASSPPATPGGELPPAGRGCAGCSVVEAAPLGPGFLAVLSLVALIRGRRRLRVERRGVERRGHG